jgi:hypothetical protein
MPLYFMLHDAEAFATLIRPALAASWHRRSFGPSLALRDALAVHVSRFLNDYRITPGDLFLRQVQPDTPFDRGMWRVLVGEVLLCAAVETPEIPAAPETLSRLLRPDSSIAHAYHGTRGLVFGGGWYRPDNAGYNNPDDVQRLANYLGSLEPDRWTTADLGLPNADESEDDRQDELKFARAALSSLQAMYEQARAKRWMVICETI